MATARRPSSPRATSDRLPARPSRTTRPSRRSSRRRAARARPSGASFEEVWPRDGRTCTGRGKGGAGSGFSLRVGAAPFRFCLAPFTVASGLPLFSCHAPPSTVPDVWRKGRPSSASCPCGRRRTGRPRSSRPASRQSKPGRPYRSLPPSSTSTWLLPPRLLEFPSLPVMAASPGASLQIELDDLQCVSTLPPRARCLGPAARPGRGTKLNSSLPPPRQAAARRALSAHRGRQAAARALAQAVRRQRARPAGGRAAGQDVRPSCSAQLRRRLG